MAAQEGSFMGLKLMYGLGILVNLVAAIFTFNNENYYFLFINIVAIVICSLRLRDIFKIEYKAK